LLIVFKRGWVDNTKVNHIIGLLTLEQRMLVGFMDKLNI
jgi:hypothetical protein